MKLPADWCTISLSSCLDTSDRFCILIDIGGEDTKVSTVALAQGELFDNAMNVKCSAGTGSLMDTLTAMFHLEDIDKACELAFDADGRSVLTVSRRLVTRVSRDGSSTRLYEASRGLRLRDVTVFDGSQRVTEFSTIT